jgi:hypothetical protein
MQRWMDGRTDARFWKAHGFALMVIGILPAVPLGIMWLTSPRLTSSERAEIELEAQRWNRVSASDNLLTIAEPPENDEFDQPAKGHSGVRFGERFQTAYDDLQRQVDGSTGPVSIDHRVLPFLVVSARMARGNGNAAPSDVTESLRSDDRYNELVALATRIAKRLRLSERIREQDEADRLEIWLTSELLDPAARAKLTPEQYDRTAKLLRDAEQRRQARRRAIAVSWSKLQRSDLQNSRFSWGGYDANYGNGPQALRGWSVYYLQRHSQFVQFTGELWDGTHGAVAEFTGMQSPTSTKELPFQDSRLRKLAYLWRVAPEYYGAGAAGRGFRVEDVRQFAHALDNQLDSIPARQWFAGWEEQARQLPARSNP